jgi:hypothetical protein
MLTINEIYQTLVHGNDIYDDNWSRWKFLLESYLGGDMYRTGEHLTRYQLETPEQYRARLAATPLDNHCRSVVNVYNSFMFREHPDRDFGSLAYDPTVADFLKDADLEGRDLDTVMKEVSTWSSVFGHCWILLSKPNIQAVTLADELTAGVRPYVSLLTPLVVLDWTYQRSPAGQYSLTYFKYIEDINTQIQAIVEWTPETITTSITDKKRHELMEQTTVPNGLGKIPAVIAYNQRSTIRGVGLSDIDDIADQQRAIYNELSEIEQSIRLDSHPSLVTTEGTKIGTGAGAVLYMDPTMDPGLKPYLLENSGADVNAIYASIKSRIESIDKMANTGGVRAVESRTMSGVALETEFQLLNARLSEKADNLELAEEQLWTLYAMYQGLTWDGEIEYPGSFNIRNTAAEIENLVKAKSAATDPRVLAYIDHELLEQLGGASDMIIPEVYTPEDIPETKPFEPHYMIDLDTGIKYIARTEQEHLDYAALGYVHLEDVPGED